MCRWSILGLLAVYAATVTSLPAAEQTAKPAAAVPQVREIRQAFQARGELPRRKLAERLLRSGNAADRPELVAAITDGLSRRVTQKTSDAGDWQLVALLAGFDSDEAAQTLVSCLGASDWRLALTALGGLLESERTNEWEILEPIAARGDYASVYALRRSLVACAEQNASRPAVEFLVKTVADADGQLKYEAAAALTRLTGQTFGGRAEEWQDWWSTARKEFAAVPLAERQPVALAKPGFVWDGPLPIFFGLPVYARRVVFIIDRSKSMASSIDGESRLERARQELEKAVEALPAGTEFNVLAYHDFVTRFVPHVVPAVPESKRQAILFAHALDPDRHTACYDALAAGLTVDPNLEAIYFLSDGEPTAGLIVDPPAIVAAITQLNRFQWTSIYTLGIDARGKHEEFLKQLAARNFGEYFLIR